MKIALFTETYLPYINGVVTHVKGLHDGLEQLGHEVLVVTVDVKTKKHYIKDGVMYCPAKEMKKIYGFGFASPFSPSRYKMLKEWGADVFHIHQEFSIGFSAIRFAKKLKLPLVHTLHTMYDDYLYYIVPQKLTPLLRVIAHRYFRWCGNSAHELTGPSAKVQEYFDLCGCKKTVNVIPNPVELDMFNPDVLDKEKIKAIREKYGVKENDTLISFCGRLGREKSVDVLLNYWAENIKAEDNLKLMILGGGPCLEELTEQAKQLGISDQVIFTGAIAHDELPEYYGACQLYVTASLSDTNSISMKEGMATGLPVLHIKDPLNAGQVVDGVNGFIYHDGKELYALINKWKAMTQEEKDALRASVIDSVKVYGCQVLGKNLLEVYAKAIEKNNAKNKKKK